MVGYMTIFMQIIQVMHTGLDGDVKHETMHESW